MGTLQCVVRLALILQSPFWAIRSVVLVSVQSTRAGERSHLAILGSAQLGADTQII